MLRSMGTVARAAAIGSAVTLAACAMIAGLDDPTDANGGPGGSTSSGSHGSVQDTGNASSSGGGSSSGASQNDATTDGASSSGAPADAQPDVPQCSLLKIGDTCQANSQCCSTKCNEKRQCASDCKGTGSFNCDPTSTDDCCVGLWCNTGSCSACVLSGQPAAEGIGGVRLAHSCCSRTLQNGFGPNCQ